MPEPQPDSRFLQANERTLLAWLRTGIALMAFGFVLARMSVWMRLVDRDVEPHDGYLRGFGVGFVLLGALCAGLAGIQYVRVRRALLAGLSIAPGGALGMALAVVLTALGCALGVYLIAR
jgi:putative membrane protein